MKTASLFLFSALLGLQSVGCNADVNADDPQATGSLELALSEAPEDARCLRVVFAGQREKDVLVELTPGENASYALKRLPTGVVTVDGFAYEKSCNAVHSTSEPAFVTESPVTARIRAGKRAIVRLALVRAGAATIEVEFEDSGEASDAALNMAVIGDTPYGTAQLAAFPRLVDAINQDPDVSRVVHVGDIKNGGSRCDDAYFSVTLDLFNTFHAPFVLTPGDNDWTDCHRANNGAYDPLERLAAVRSVFFGSPGQTLGNPAPVVSQAAIAEHSTFVENQLWTGAQVVFAAIHVVGSANGYAPWFTNDTTGTHFDEPDRRIAETEARIAAAVDWIDRAFALAESDDAAGVALFMQADTFIGSTLGFEAIISLLAERSAAFERPVLLVQGDSHRYLVDQPLLDGNAAYGITTAAPNLTRVVVEGENVSEWLKLTVDPSSDGVFAWSRETL